MNKLTILTRCILRQKLNSGIIIISLSIGLACFNLIIMFINRELKTDDFHDQGNRIFTLKCNDPWIPGAKMYQCRFGSAGYMKKNYAAVEDFCRINNAGVQKIIANNEEYFDQLKIISVSKNFFSFFSYRLFTNNPGTALEAENNLVLSEDLAKKYFGSGEAVGQVIKFVNRGKEEQMVVTGIFKKPLDNTQINFDMVRPIGEVDSRCYVRIAKEADKDDLEKFFAENKETIPVINDGTPGPYYLEPLKQAYFDVTRGSSVEASRDKTDLWIALVIGLMIIGIASFNYLGLLNNKLVERNKDYIIKRINGGSKLSLILDFMAENSIIIGVSFMFGIFLMQEMLPFFNELTGSNITESYTFQSEQIVTLIAVILFLLLLTFVFVLIRIKSAININTLKSGNNLTVSRIQLPAFNIFQLACSVALIICSIVIIKQMRFISNKPIGLDKNVIEVKLPGQHSDKVKDFNSSDLKSRIEPAFISYSDEGSHLMVKASGNQAEKARETIAQVWEKLIPDYPVNIESIRDRYEWLHSDNKNYIRLIDACSIISLFLSMIGLFAVSYQTSRFRIKEIGIRKINGARIIEILELLNKDFVKWVGISFIIACSVAWYAMHKWLQNFAYKTEFSWWVFALAGVITLTIALITVSWQSWRAATRNPVEALRYE